VIEEVEGFVWTRPADGVRHTLGATRGRLDWLPTPIGRPAVADFTGQYVEPPRQVPLIAESGFDGNGEPRWLRPLPPDQMLNYQPFKERPAIYGEFVALDSFSDEALMGFADRYGLLGLRVASGLDGEFYEDASEPLTVWGYCVREMSAFAAIARLALTHVEEFRVLQQGSVVEVDLEESFDDPPKHLRENQPRHPTRRWLVPPQLAELVNYDKTGLVLTLLSQHLSEWLKPLADWSMDYDELDPEARPRRLHLGLRPNSLLGTMWIQAASLLDVQVETRRCRGCGKPFSVYSSEGWGDDFVTTGRKSRVYCNDYCGKRFRRRGGIGPRARQQRQRDAETDD
jgi:hypothetical protein